MAKTESISDERLANIIDGFTGLEICADSDRLDPAETLALATELQALRAANSDGGVGPMTAEEIRLEDLKQMAAYAGPIVSFEYREPFYLASCDKCGWVGSSETCGADSFGDDSDVYCPRCHASGADCGKVAEKLSSIAHPPAKSLDGIAVTDEMVDRACKAYRDAYPDGSSMAGGQGMRSALTAALK